MIDYTEFLAATLSRKQYMQEDIVWSAFRVFDLDGDGQITREELAQVLSGDAVTRALLLAKLAKIVIFLA